jgi:hypothetical protein
VTLVAKPKKVKERKVAPPKRRKEVVQAEIELPKERMRGQVMYTYVAIDDKVPIHKLSLANMIRAIFLKLNESDRDELKNEAIVTKHYNTLRAELVDFFRKATLEIRKGNRKNVLVRVSSEYSPVIEGVAKEDSFASFYKFTIRAPRKTFPGVKFKYKVLIELRED